MQKSFDNYLDCSEAIARCLARNAPIGWERIEALVEIFHESGSVGKEIKCWLPGSSENDWFGIEDANEDFDLSDWFIELAHLVKSSDGELFKTCVFRLTSNGAYEAEYGYADAE